MAPEVTSTAANAIRLTRTSEWKNYFRAFAIFIDGKRVGKIRNGQTVILAVDPGEHELFVKIDWCMSNTVGLRILQDEMTDLVCGSGFAGKMGGAGVFSGVEGAYVAVWPAEA